MEYNRVKINLLPILILVLVISNIIGPIPSAGLLYPMIMALVLIFCILFGEKLSIDISVLSIVLIAAISTFINDPPSYFRSWERLGLFIIMAGVVSPLFQNRKFNFLRLRMFYWLMIFSVTITLTSFTGYFMGVNYAVSEGLDALSHFGGITVQSMILGPIAAISMCYTLYLAVGKDVPKKKKYLFTAAAFISFLTVLLAASRSALLGGMVALLYLLFDLNKNHFNRWAKNLILMLLVIAISFPVWSQFTIRVMQKSESGIEQGNVLSSRENLWDSRIKEFKSSPFIGVGYAAASEDTDNTIDKSTGQIEPGSSWLAISSMLGIFGLVPFIFLFGRNLYDLYKDNSKYSALLGSVLIFFAVHMFAEGYIFGAGGFLFFFLWLTIGTALAYLKTRKIRLR
jgi:O-antigen ligase